MINRLAFVVAASLLATSSFAQIASDNFENNNPSAAYNDGIQYGDNGGTGFGPLTYLEGSNGGIFAAAIDGQALGIFPGTGPGDAQALGRTVSSPLTLAVYSLTIRFDLDNAVNFSGFNLKSTLGSTFGSGELLFVGLTPSNGNGSLVIGDGTGGHTLVLGTATDLRNKTIDFSISIDTTAATYALTATIRGTGDSGTFNGSLKDTNGATPGTGSFSAVGFANFNTGSFQNLLVDNLLVAIPEPTTFSLVGIGGILAVGLLRKRVVASRFSARRNF